MKSMRRLAGLALAMTLAAPGGASAEKIFVPLGDGNAIVVIDAATDKVVGRIADIAAAHGLAGTPDGRYLVAGSSRTRAPGAQPARPAEVSEAEHAQHHAPGAQDAAGSDAISTVTIVRQSDLVVERRIDVTGAVHHVAASPDSRLAVVTHPGRNGASVIELASGRVVQFIATGRGASYAAFSRDGVRLYVSNSGDNSVAEIDTRSWKVLGAFKVGREPEHLVIAPNGRHLYVNNVKGGTVTEIYLTDPRSPRRTREFRVGANPHGIDVSDDSDWIFVAVQDDGKLVAINRKKQPQKALALAPEPYHLATLRARGKLYVSSAKEPKIWVIDATRLEVAGEIAIDGKGHQMVQGPRP